MGDPRKRRKQYKTPGHPWQKARIDEEKVLTREYGFANKKEIWKVNTLLLSFKARAKKLLSATGDSANKDREELMGRLARLGILEESATVDDILGLSFRDIADRRLQSLVMRKGLARTVKQARQFIVHRHILVGDKKLSSPSYLVLKSEEESIAFVENSNLANEEHPERAVIKAESQVKEVVAEETKEEETTVNEGESNE